MATVYKRISTKAGTRYVKVLASGQYRFVKKSVYDKAKGKKGSSTSSKKKSGGKSKTVNNRSIGIPSLTSMAVAGVAGLWLVGRRTEHGIPLHEAARGNAQNAVLGVLKNAAATITTAEGWMKVIAPIVAIGLIRKVLPRVQASILGVKWRVL
jgi:hypothetical protein